MKVTVLGCSGSVPGPDSPGSGYLIEHDGYRLVLDLGHGAFGALQRYVSPADVDAIILSHLHADHCIDMTAYLVSLRFGGAGHRATGRIPLVGPSGTRDRLGAAYDPLARKLGLQELFGFSTPRSGELGPFALSFATTNHPVPTSAVKIMCDGRSLVYSADTGECPDLVTLASGADTFLCEATFGPDDEVVPDVHLTARQAGEHAAKAGVGRLVVTHVPPWGSRDVAVAEASATFGGTVEAATAGAVFEI